MKISIVTVCYNSEKTIKHCIESVLAQSHDEIEHIIIDGKSTDNTLDIIKEYSGGNIHYVSEKDSGIYDAMNKGIKLATGDLVGILNSDDFYASPDILTAVVNTFTSNIELEAVIGDVSYINPKNHNKTVRYYSSKNFNTSMFKFGFMPPHASFFTKKKHFDQFGYYKTDYEIAADFELILRFFKKHNLNYKRLCLNMVYMRTGGISTNSYKSNVILNREIVRACKENNVYSNIFMVYLKYFFKIFQYIRLKN
jgi:glycosyltransferase involved in cell wall biosynthesis